MIVIVTDGNVSRSPWPDASPGRGLVAGLALLTSVGLTQEAAPASLRS